MPQSNKSNGPFFKAKELVLWRTLEILAASEWSKDTRILPEAKRALLMDVYGDMMHETGTSNPAKNKQVHAEKPEFMRCYRLVGR